MKLTIAVTMLLLPVAAGNAADAPQDRMTTKTFSVQPGGRLKVRLAGGDVAVATWSKNEVLVSVTGPGEQGKDELSMTQTGNTVEVSGEMWPAEGPDMRVKVTVPTQFDVDLQTAYGDLEIAGPLKGDIEASSAGGDVRLRALSGTVKVKTSGGDISSETIEGSLDAATMGGDLSIGTVSGALELSTMGGDVKVDKAGAEASVSTAGGDVTLGEVAGRVQVSTAGGDIRVAKAGGPVKLRTAGGDIVVQSAPAEVSVSTSGGDLSVSGAVGPVTASTAGGDVILSLGAGKILKSKVSTAHGDVTLYVPDGTKATIEARIRISGYGEDEGFEITSDFPVQQMPSGEGGEKKATIQVNGGGEVVTIETMAGSIAVKRGGAPPRSK